MPRPVEHKDIQGIVPSGYDHLDHARFVFLQIDDRGAARDWLASIVVLITDARHPGNSKSNACLNFAISWSGLEALGVSKLIEGFPHEFVYGMNRPEAHPILGDTGESHSKYWEYGGDPADPLHLLVLLYGKTPADLDLLFQTACGPAALHQGLHIAKVENSSRQHGDYTEPFGFRDGISQPPVAGLVGGRPQTEHAISAGEFVLGCDNELGQLTRIPSLSNWKDPVGYLSDHPEFIGKRRGFGLNGTYLVFRKLQQDVDGFWAFIDSQSKGPQGVVNLKERELLAAKLVGRWRSGAPLVFSPETPGSEPRNDFLYMTLDRDGQRCPIGSHIRRANPRDSLDLPPSRSILISRRHRLIRRGRKFYEPADANHPKPRQGIFFIALNADLRRQFEFVQQLWINSPNFNGLDNDKDPIVGDNGNDGHFTVQGKPFNRHIQGLQRFVTVRGGGYFFLPGIGAVKFLANYQP